MVRISDTVIDTQLDLSMYPFSLSIWQQNAIWGIIHNKNVIVSAPTGSGKTLPAEHAIQYFSRLNKKVIYTTPIKALSNQKKHDFSEKFPDISVGILTGDIKDNPHADVILMTTEILKNYFDHNVTHNNFDIDIENDVGMIIYDEAHYINDEDRGHIWEECFIKQPKHIPMLLMSATIDNLNKISAWLEDTTSREVVLSITHKRIVPLEHYFWYGLTDNSVKKIKDKPLLALIDKYTNKPILIKDDSNEYKVGHHDDIQKIINKTGHIHIRPYFIINQIVNYLCKEQLTPAICFLYSRDKVEQYAKFVEANLHTEKYYTQIIEKECEAILRRLPNYKEYLVLDEYKQLVKLLEKGVGIHHSGMIPIFKELVEIMFTKHYVQILFATETFSVGLNMPTKTVIFTNLYKFDGTCKRLLYNNEYTQQAGRAGRRGFDTKGIVIHLNNLFDFPTNTEYKSLLVSKPAMVSSKFKLSYDIILNKNLNTAYKSLMQLELTNQISEYEDIITAQTLKLESLNTRLATFNTSQVLEEYHTTTSNKKKHELEKQFHSISNDYITYNEYLELNKSIQEYKQYIQTNNNYISYYLNFYKHYLIDRDFIDKDSLELTKKGEIAKSLNEVHYLSMANITIATEYFKSYSVLQLIGIFSVFSNITITNNEPYIEDKRLLHIFSEIETEIEQLHSYETRNNIYSTVYTKIQTIIPYYTMLWANAKDEKDCLYCLHLLYNYENIYTGDFIKTLLKVINICREYESICTAHNEFDLLEKITQIYPLLLKFFVTNHSLYI